uniref:Collagen alpha-1(VIII) chain-like n=1 Tax=Sinocyclocheilus anshuiensis TaxID=1608454 RepID=A0A671QDY5_9TELE
MPRNILYSLLLLLFSCDCIAEVCVIIVYGYFLTKHDLIHTKFKVAFGATLGSTGNFGPFNSPVTLVYNNVYVNEGSAYNPNTGVCIFTAPVKGAYFFSFSGHNCSSKVLNLGLFKNGEQMVIVFNHPLGDHYESTANSVSLTLEKGDRVYVRLRETSWVFDNYSHHNSFVGHLLFPL